MLEWLWNAPIGLFLGTLGFVIAVASLLYGRSQAKGAHAQVESARRQAVDALRAAELVAEGAREQALEALRAADLVAENARVQAVQALTAAGLVAEDARLQAAQALRAAELVASSAVSARVREMRARNLRFNPALPPSVRLMMKQAGGPDAYGLLLDAIDIAQEIFSLRKGGVVSDDHWRMWINDQIGPMASSETFKAVFRRAVENGSISSDFSTAFAPAFDNHPITDPWTRAPVADLPHDGNRNGGSTSTRSIQPETAATPASTVAEPPLSLRPLE